MNITGPLSTRSVQRDETAVSLRPNQRFSAEVLQVAGDRVVLSVGGVQIVARLTSPEQAAALGDRRSATFQVRDLSNQTISLQLVQPGENGAFASGAPLPPSDLVSNLLSNAGISADQANIFIARALISQGLPVTTEMIANLRQLLDEWAKTKAQDSNNPALQGTWGQTEAQLAAALRASGLPISSGTLSLMANDLTPMVEVFSQLRSSLAEFLKGEGLPTHLAELVKNALGSLDDLVVDWSASPTQIAEKLRQAIAAMGKSIEREFAELSRQGATSFENSSLGNSLLTLAELRRELARTGSNPLLNEIDRFLDQMRLRQFTNAEPFSPTAREQWLSLDLPLGLPSRNMNIPPEMNSSQLRMAYRVERGARHLDSDQSHLVIQVEMDAGEVVQVDLSIANRKIGAVVTTTSQELLTKAQAGLPEFKAGLEKLGYLVQSARCLVGQPAATTASSSTSNWKSFQEINVEV